MEQHPNWSSEGRMLSTGITTRKVIGARSLLGGLGVFRIELLSSLINQFVHVCRLYTVFEKRKVSGSLCRSVNCTILIGRSCCGCHVIKIKHIISYLEGYTLRYIITGGSKCSIGLFNLSFVLQRENSEIAEKGAFLVVVANFAFTPQTQLFYDRSINKTSAAHYTLIS